MLAVEATNGGADTILIIINVALGLATSFGMFILKKLDSENDRRRNDIKELYEMSADIKKEIADHKLECSKSFVPQTSMDLFREECIAKIEKIDSKFDKLQELILNQLSNNTSRARP